MLQELKEQKIWLLYRKKENANGRTDKKPFAANGKASGSDEKHRNTWVTYDEAVSAMKKNKADGVGFVVPAGYFFLDIDHQELDSPVVQEIIDKFSTYTELSQSEEGVHLYGKCQTFRIPSQYDVKEQRAKLNGEYYTKNPNNGFEIYVGGLTNRFAVFTGKAVNECELTDGTDAILEFLEAHMKKSVKESKKKEKGVVTKKATKKTAEVNKNPEVDLQKIVDEICSQKNGDKFFKLYYQGNTDEYSSQSEADIALCQIIGFKTENENLVDEIFRRSKLYRSKWEEGTYAEETIEKAMEAVYELKEKEKAEFRREKNRPSFVLVDERGKEFVSKPHLAQYIKTQVPYLLVKDEANQTTRKYVYEKGCYRLYDDNMMEGVIKEEIEKYDNTLVDMKHVKEVLQYLKAERHFMDTSELNSDEKIINFENGILEVTADKLVLKEHSPSIYSTIQIPCQWKDYPSDTPVFDAYMKTLTNGNKEVENLLLQFMGVAISNVLGHRMKKALFMVGKGDSGKSQLKALAERLLGKANCVAIDLHEMETRFGPSKVYGKRLVGTADMGFISINELRIFKQLTGGDSINAEYKHQNGFDFIYQGVLWFCMNKLPKFKGDQGEWVYERMIVVRCDNSIPLVKQDKELLNKMYAERQGIIYKCIKALQKVIANGYRYDEPDCVKEGRTDYQRTNSTIISFFEECMQKEKTCEGDYSTGRVFDAYKGWCRDNNGGYYETVKEFRDVLCQYLGKNYSDITRRVNGRTYFKDYYLTKEAEYQYLMK